MDTVWIVVGAAIILVTMVDTFLSVLNYNERGLVVNRVARWTWVTLRVGTRRLSAGTHQTALRRSTGLITVAMIFTWLLGVLLGFALVYFGAMGAGAIKVDPGAPQGFWAALYMSIGQFSTVGVENISSVHPLIDYLTVIQALSSVVLLSMIVAFLLNVFSGIQALRSLCADFARPAEGDGAVLAPLYPYFPGGAAIDVERYLTTTVSDMNAYGDVLRQTRTTYYFQSGDEQFSAPYALISVSTMVGALRWGFPVGSTPVSRLPGLFRLEESLSAARRWISDEMLHLPDAAAPPPLSEAAFAAQWKRCREQEYPDGVDPYVAGFDSLCRAAARLTSPSRSDEAVADADVAEAYARYVEWLPFGWVSERFNVAVSRDLDFRPRDRAYTSRPFDPRGVAQALPPA
ncbi:hypothetical protein ACFQZV_13160 [Microbacterium koreense]|uniref:Ion transport domain-containing protein n=1 Tax=Microbacterium koreense TaxID=323761 RepID=A0ABW2ZUF0_9MICO